MLRSIYFAISDLYLSYCFLVWAQNCSTIQQIVVLHGLVFPQINYETSISTQVNLTKLFYKTNRSGKYSVTVSVVESWGKIQKQIKSTLLEDLSPNKIKTNVSNFYLKLCYELN